MRRPPIDVAFAGPFVSGDPACATDRPELFLGPRWSLHRKEPGCVVGEQRQGREGLWGLDEEEEAEFLESMEGGLEVEVVILLGRPWLRGRILNTVALLCWLSSSTRVTRCQHLLSRRALEIHHES